ncbi:four helix bundle protein [Winogradskyella luteola]|uniref:Four helix bundle protein n=1 Tax=Winogradskyella luteola TaxID=2828330 RepID=A0A9X1F8J2_9FLAO|nr:four helix bundle protein [Winogradskyella luteola]MBV7269322.1 four helix bundle protein [Winogradskyella luteola]
MKRHNFKKLHIWIEAMDLIDDNYSIAHKLPDYEKYGLRSQMNRCSVSIASNISEGISKKTNKHFIQFLENSLGSAFEWETQLIICFRQNFIEENKFLDLQNKIQKIQSKISNFIDSLNHND